jgi:hypothetical protein
MPVTYRIDQERRRISTTCVGDVSFQEVMDHFAALETDPHCPERLDVLLDLTTTTSLPDAEQVRAVGARIGETRRRVRFGACAIVTDRDAMFGMSRMLEVLAEPHFKSTSVFRKLEDAERWLDAEGSPAGRERGHDAPA